MQRYNATYIFEYIVSNVRCARATSDDGGWLAML